MDLFKSAVLRSCCPYCGCKHSFKCPECNLAYSKKGKKTNTKTIYRQIARSKLKTELYKMV